MKKSVFILFIFGFLAGSAMADLTNGLVSYWNFDDAANPGRDYSISGNTLTLSGVRNSGGEQVGVLITAGK